MLPTHRRKGTPKKQSLLDLIGAPMTAGQPLGGTDRGPKLLRQRGLTAMLEDLEWMVNDVGDLDFTSASETHNQSLPKGCKAQNHEIVGAGCERLALAVQESLKEQKFPLILGGDHSIGMGSLAGILQHDCQTGVIWVDAHADINTPWTSTTGNMHGMPIGMLLDYPNKEDNVDFNQIPGCEWLSNYPRLPPESIVYIGLRDVDPPERKLIKDIGIKTFTMYDIDHHGIGKVMDKALAHLSGACTKIHLSLDIDAVDPQWAPATGTRVRGGLTYREAHYVAEAIFASERLQSAEIVEVNPKLHQSEETIDLGLQLITSFMGKSII